jgi:hypothetical protein
MGSSFFSRHLLAEAYNFRIGDPSARLITASPGGECPHATAEPPIRSNASATTELTGAKRFLPAREAL